MVLVEDARFDWTPTGSAPRPLPRHVARRRFHLDRDAAVQGTREAAAHPRAAARHPRRSREREARAPRQARRRQPVDAGLRSDRARARLGRVGQRLDLQELRREDRRGTPGPPRLHRLGAALPGRPHREAGGRARRPRYSFRHVRWASSRSSRRSCAARRAASRARRRSPSSRTKRSRCGTSAASSRASTRAHSPLRRRTRPSRSKRTSRPRARARLQAPRGS